MNLRHAAGTEMASPDFVRRFVATARKLGLHSFIDGIDTPELAARHAGAKADYLGGRQFAELTDYVGPMSQTRMP
jgi:EAL domain-containing protein (putative c-di-GMP-specific phosphodiesterase class I)